MICPLEVGIDPCSPDNASGLWVPCFGASAVRMEVSESILCLQLHFEYQASGPLVQNNSPAKSVLDVTTSLDLVFSSDRSCDRFTGKPVSQTTGLYYEYQRWYDPSIGRFISQDPMAGYLSDPQSLVWVGRMRLLGSALSRQQLHKHCCRRSRYDLQRSCLIWKRCRK